jgi:hypothetical protein
MTIVVPGDGGGGSGVSSFNGRTGVVTLVVADVEALFTVAGQLFVGTGNGTGERLGIGTAGQVLTVGGADPSGLEWATPATAPVSSVFTRTGAVVATSGDYAVGQITGAAPLASPALTGTPTAPTATPGDNTTKIATTAFIVASFAPLASPALTGTPTAPTAAALDNSTKIATTAYVDSADAVVKAASLPIGQYYLWTTTTAGVVLPAGTYKFRLVGAGGAGGGAAAGTNGAHSGGGGSASYVFEPIVVSDGVTAYTITIATGGAGVSASNGNGGGFSSIAGGSPSVNWSAGTSQGGFASTNATPGYGGVPGQPVAITAAPGAFAYWGAGGGLSFGPNGGFFPGLAAGCLVAGCIGGGAGAANNSSLGGNGGQQGLIDNGGGAGTGNTGTTTGGVGGAAAANSGCGGGGAGGSFTGGGAVTGGAGGSGWVEAWRIA